MKHRSSPPRRDAPPRRDTFPRASYDVAVRRTRSLARELGTRVWVGPDQVLAVDGRTHWAVLAEGFRGACKAPKPGAEPHPSAFGFPLEAFSEMSVRGLSGRARALKRWSRDVADADRMRDRDRGGRGGRGDRRDRRGPVGRGRPGRPPQGKAMAGREDRAELQELERRLDLLHRLLDGSVKPAGVGCFLPAVEAGGRVERDGDAPPSLAWLAALCAWVGGATARRRFLDCVAGVPELPSPERAAAVAAMAAVDGSDAPLPPELFEGADADECAWLQRLGALVRESRHPGYGALLAFLRHAPPELRSPWLYPSLRRLLEEGATEDDLSWLAARAPGTLASLAHARRVPRALRELLAFFETRGLTPPADEVAGMIRAHERRFVDLLFRRGLDLARRLPARALPPRTARLLWRTLLQAESLARTSEPFRSFLGRWAEPEGRVVPLEDLPEGLPAPCHRALDELARHLRLAGREARPSRTLKRLLDRWTAAPDAEGAKAIAGKAERLAAVTALETLRHETERAGLRLARETCRVELPEGLDPGMATRVAAWSHELGGEDQRRLAALWSAWSAAGSRWRGALDANRAWLDRPETPAWKLAPWFVPPEEEIDLPDGLLRIRGPRHPWEILTMGDPFATGLNLGDGCDARAVIANAMDANKQVLFVLDAAGRLVGRKLLALTDDGRMIGYRSHGLTGDETGEGRRALHAYCGRLAALCGFALGDDGCPARLASEFWVDDGGERWLPAARLALDGDGPGEEERWSALLRDRDEDLRAIRKNRALREDPPDRRAREELLAELVLDGRAAPGFARELLSLARSASGLTAALVALLRVEGDGALVAVNGRLPDEAWARARVAAELLRLDGDEACAWIARHVLDGQLSALDPAWLPVLAASSIRGARAAEDGLRSSPPRVWDDAWPVTLSLSARRQGRPPADEALLHLVDLALRNGTGSDMLGPWLPPFRRPGKMLRRSLLKDWLDTGRASWWSLPVEMGSTFVAQRNPGPDSAGFLRDRAEACPGALLALAITVPRRFDRFLEKRVQEWKARPAAALAACEGLGPRRAQRVLGDAFPAARRLQQAMTTLDLPAMEKELAAFSAAEAARCAPLFVHALERDLATPSALPAPGGGALASGLWRVLAPRAMTLRLALHGRPLSPRAKRLLALALEAEGEGTRSALALALRPEGPSSDGKAPLAVGDWLAAGLLGPLVLDGERGSLREGPWSLETAPCARTALLDAAGERAGRLLAELAAKGLDLADRRWPFRLDELQAEGAGRER